MRILAVVIAMMVTAGAAGPLTPGDGFAALEHRQVTDCPNDNDDLCIQPSGNLCDVTKQKDLGADPKAVAVSYFSFVALICSF